MRLVSRHGACAIPGQRPHGDGEKVHSKLEELTKLIEATTDRELFGPLQSGWNHG